MVSSKFSNISHLQATYIYFLYQKPDISVLVLANAYVSQLQHF